MSYFYGKQSQTPSYMGGYQRRGGTYTARPRTPGTAPYGGGDIQPRFPQQQGYQGMGEFQMPPEMQALYQKYAGGGGGAPGGRDTGWRPEGVPGWEEQPIGWNAQGQPYSWEVRRAQQQPGGGAPGGQIPDYQYSPDMQKLMSTLTGRATEIAGTPYALPEDVQGLMGRLGERGQEFLSRRPGYGEATMGAMFGQDYDRLRQAGLAQQQTAMEGLQAGGQLGTGAQADVAQQMAWGQQKNIGDLMRDVALREEEQKRADLYGYTGAAQDITGQLGQMRLGEEQAQRQREAMATNILGAGVGYQRMPWEMGLQQQQIGLQGQAQEQDVFRNLMAYQQMIEQMNAQRRGEGRQGFQDFMRYMGMNMQGKEMKKKKYSIVEKIKALNMVCGMINDLPEEKQQEFYRTIAKKVKLRK